MSQKKFMLEEFIGKDIQAKRENIKGKIIDETKSTFTVKTTKGEKKILKKGNTFTFQPDGIEIKGDDIIVRPEDRIKFMVKKWKAK